MKYRIVPYSGLQIGNKWTLKDWDGPLYHAKTVQELLDCIPAGCRVTMDMPPPAEVSAEDTDRLRPAKEKE